MPKAVFEIDAEIFHRLAPQLLDDALVNGRGKIRANAHCFRQRLLASGAYSANARSASFPNLRVVSDLNKCAPP